MSARWYLLERPICSGCGGGSSSGWPDDDELELGLELLEDVYELELEG